MEKVKLGTRVNRLGIQRISVAEGSKCRAILLDMNPRMKHVAFDDDVKRSVEVTQDMCLRYRLRPYPTFYYLVAKLNTDLHGTVIGDRFTVEYLQLSENLNNEFVDAIEEQGVPKSLSLTKVKKVADGGKDFSYIKVTISAQDPLIDNAKLAKKIEELRSNSEFIENCWALIDACTTIPVDEYMKLKGQALEEKALPGNKQQPKKALPKKDAPQVEEPVEAASDFADANEFGDVSEFGDDFDQ